MTTRAVVLLLAALLPGAMRTRPADEHSADSAELMKRAERAEDLRSEDGRPFRLRAHLEVNQGKQVFSGEYGLMWESPKRWRDELKLDGYGMLRVGTDGGYWQIRSTDYQPLVVFDFDELIDIDAILRLEPEQAAEKPESRKIGKEEMPCVQVRWKRMKAKRLCFDPSAGVLMHVEFPGGSGIWSKGARVVDYSDVQTFFDREIPRKIQAVREGQYKMQIDVTSIEPLGNVNPTAFAEPAKAEFWGACRNPVASAGGSKSMPDYPGVARSSRIEGTVILYVRIEPDGSTSHIRALASSSPLLTEAAIEAVRKWTYAPYTCGGKPVRRESVVEISFSLGE